MEMFGKKTHKILLGNKTDNTCDLGQYKFDSFKPKISWNIFLFIIVCRLRYRIKILNCLQ